MEGMTLLLERPLACIDVETTGTSHQIDRIVQFGVVKLYPDGKRTEWETLINPEGPIPPEVAAVHGVTDETIRLERAPTFKAVAPLIEKGLQGCDIAGYNVGFDVRFLVAELRRCGRPPQAGLFDGVTVDAYKIFRRAEPHDLTSAVKRYLKRERIGAHSALADAREALDVLVAQLAEHTDLPRTPRELYTFFELTPRGNQAEPSGKIILKHGEPVLNFGNKFNGVPLKNVDTGYLEWILRGEFSSSVKQLVNAELERRKSGNA